MNNRVTIKAAAVSLSLLMLGGVTLSSCADSDFLNLEPYTEGDTNNDYYKDKANLRASVDALNRFTSEEGITGRGYMWMENASDNLTTGRPQAQAAQIKNFTMDAANGSASTSTAQARGSEAPQRAAIPITATATSDSRPLNQG